MSGTAVMEPEVELKVSDTDDVDRDDGDDGDRPGWLITFLDGRQPEVVRLEDTNDSELTEEEVFERFDQADKAGHSFFKLGRYRGRMGVIRSLSWSEDVDLLELVVFDSLQDRLEGTLEAVEEAAGLIGETARNTTVLQQQMGALQGAFAEQLYEEIADNEEEAAQASAPAPKKAGALKPLKIPGKGSTPAN